MKWIDHFIYADYWTRIKIILVFFPLIVGATLTLHHQKWGLWLMLAGAVLFLVMLIQRLFRHGAPESKTLEQEKQQSPPWWISTEHWDIRIKAALIVVFAAGGIAMKFILHLKTFRLAIAWPAIFLLFFVLQKVFPERPGEHKPGPDEASKLHLS